MRWNKVCIAFVVAASIGCVAPNLSAATFGRVVPIGGHAADVALDESRGVLYIANFTANRIEVMSTADFLIQRSMNVAPQPSSISLSPDNQYLLISHFGNLTTPDPSRNAITLINLNDNTRQTFTTGDVPLSVTFMADDTALIVTTSGFLKFDPISGALAVVATFKSLATPLPTELATFPTQIILAATSTTPDRTVAYGIADGGGSQAFFRYEYRGSIFAVGVVASPKPLPRIGVSADGSWAMVGQYKVSTTIRNLAQFPNSISSTNIGGVAV